MHLHVCHQLLPLQEAAVALVAFVHNAVQGQVAPQCLGVGHLGPADLHGWKQECCFHVSKGVDTVMQLSDGDGTYDHFASCNNEMKTKSLIIGKLLQRCKS